MDQRFEQTAFYPADILLPQTAEMKKWPVVACDQFTSQPDYWQAAEAAVGEAPSALRLVLPEVYLNGPDVDKRIETINASMDRYLADGLFRTLSDSLIYLERTQSDGRVRHGLIGCVDLEQYDFTPGSGALIRATEGTVLERIPPRVRVREHAALELPHVMLLIDDPRRSVIEPLTGETGVMEALYDTDLMLGGGHVKGWRLTDSQMGRVANALSALKSPEAMADKYGMADSAPLLFAVGDGNHSLATAKACYENLKKVTPPERWASLPARYALVEVVNLHDDALTFEPIHRVLFNVDCATVLLSLITWSDANMAGCCFGGSKKQPFTLAGPHMANVLSFEDPTEPLTVGTIDDFISDYIERHPEAKVDYVHDEPAVRALCKQGAVAFLMPPFAKSDLFRGVVMGGVLPRKTFSMGHAEEKRYYIECRKITE